jgi:predicted nucleotidyltransferase
MTNSSLSLKRPLDAALVTLLADVDLVCKSVHVDYLLTGSLPREIALYHVFGLDKGRGTADVDFGISVQSWEQFEQLRAAFLASGQFEKDFNPSVFWSRRPGRLQVDLVPFGAIQKDDGAIAWRSRGPGPSPAPASRAPSGSGAWPGPSGFRGLRCS